MDAVGLRRDRSDRRRAAAAGDAAVAARAASQRLAVAAAAAASERRCGTVRTVSRMVALLRGINLGAARRVSMADLRACLEELGYENVETLLQSGNVVYRGTDAAASS